MSEAQPAPRHTGQESEMSARGIPLRPDRGEHTTRRDMLRWLIRAAYGAFGLAFVLPAVALRTLRQETKTVAAGDVLVYATGDRAGTPLKADQLQAGGAAQAFPEGKTEESSNLIEVVRLSDDPSSIVAYSAICTHLGCSVLAQLSENNLIYCPCHASEFDPADNAAVRRGPAARPLPSLPVEVGADGTITATGGFSGKVGPD